MMLSRLFCSARATPDGSVCRNIMLKSRVSLSNELWRTTSFVMSNLLSPQITLQNKGDLQLTQTRSRMTKAQSRRRARFELRQKFALIGKSLPRPPFYTPIDVPVVNGFTPEERMKESRDFDEKAAVELREKLKSAISTQRDQFLRSHMTGVQMSDRVRKLFELHNGNQREVVGAQKQLGMQVFQIREGDTGSTGVQVVALTTRIQQLQTHMGKHKKDMHSKRGLDALYTRRRKLLDYLERKDFTTYRKVVKTLGLIRA